MTPTAPGSDALAGSALVTFSGTELSPEAERLLADPAVAGVSLGRHRNVRDAAQVRALTDSVQAAAGPGGEPSALPRLVAADQEGGQLAALGEGFTPFAGNLALGATGDVGLAERVAAATARELRAVGVNVNYAPVCDLALNPRNASLGTRSFGDDPATVAALVAATVRGFEANGVAATAKHFPGAGDIAADPHHELPVLAHGRDRLLEIEAEPFRAAIAAGASLVMMSHLAVPCVDGREDLPASVSPGVIEGLLRRELGFDGVVLSDALDMRALGQDLARAVEAVAALRAGEDLLLLWDEVEPERRLLDALAVAARRGLLDPAARAASRGRVDRLRGRLIDAPQPELEVVGCAEHRAIAREVAERSVTLVRDDAGILPLRSDVGRVAVVTVRPADLTPADTSSTVRLELADAMRARHPDVDAFETSHPPTDGEIADLRSRVADAGVVVLGTLDASRDPKQTELVEALFEAGPPVVWVAMRTPWDLPVRPAAPTYVCTYGILRPQMDALTAAIVGDAPFAGGLPVAMDVGAAR
jgi:beta-N-acetylhexosaminidase